MSDDLQVKGGVVGASAPTAPTALSSADADQAASRLAPHGLQSTGACEDCRWFHCWRRKGEIYDYWPGYGTSNVTAPAETTTGQCRALPPAFSQTDLRADGWPTVEGGDWCGSFVSIAGEPK